LIKVSFYLFFKITFEQQKIIFMQPNETNKELEQLFTNPEPWEKWESKLVFGSIIVAIISLTILGFLINSFLLK